MADDQWSSVAGSWWEAHRLSNGGRADRKALSLGQPESAVKAQEIVEDAVDAGGPPAIELLRALASATSDPEELAYLGAGPIEELVALHGVPAASHVAEAARIDPQFARAVASMWVPSDLPQAGRDLLAPWVAGGTS